MVHGDKMSILAMAQATTAFVLDVERSVAYETDLTPLTISQSQDLEPSSLPVVGSVGEEAVTSGQPLFTDPGSATSSLGVQRPSPGPVGAGSPLVQSPSVAQRQPAMTPAPSPASPAPQAGKWGWKVALEDMVLRPDRYAADILHRTDGEPATVWTLPRAPMSIQSVRLCTLHLFSLLSPSRRVPAHRCIGRPRQVPEGAPPLAGATSRSHQECLPPAR